MGSAWKYFLFFSFVVFFLSGCQKEKSSNENGAPAYAPSTSADTTTSSAHGPKIDLNKLSQQDRVKIKRLAYDVKALMKMNKKADEVFQQAWGAYVGDFSQRPSNVFRALKTALDSSFAEDGIPFRQTKAQACKGVSLQSAPEAEITHSFSVIQGKCQTKTSGMAMASVQVLKNSQGRIYYQVTYAKEPQWVGNFLSAFGSVQFDANQRDEVRAYSIKPENIICQMYPDVNLGLAQLYCRDLGQDISRSSALIFKSMNWVAGQEVNGLRIKGYRVKNDDNGPAVVTSFELTENSNDNLISIVEKEIGSKKEEINRKVPSPEMSLATDESKAKKAEEVLMEAVKSAQAEFDAQQPQEPQQTPSELSGDQVVDPSMINAVTGEIEPSVR